MEKEMSTWWFAGTLIGAVEIARSHEYSDTARQLMAELALDLVDNWEFADDRCRRIERRRYESKPDD